MFQAKDVMKTDLITVNRHTPIHEAIRILVDDDMTLVGMITEKDVLKLLPAWISDTATVDQFMSDDVVTFETDTNLIEICECLVHSHFRRVPIVSHGKLKGVISRKDLIRYIIEPIG